jgi:Diadenosine tetraphosphate (Ap4A) hydrolase and other HIT family hydrolases
MDHLWSPWRYQYVSKSGPAAGCIFCLKGSQQQDRENHVIHRGPLTFVILNLYPYTTGHLMIAPYEHIASLEPASEATVKEMMQMARLAEIHLRQVYQPQGFNIGMNLGESAGAGVPGHIHLHVLPRWSGDTNFMTTVAETRVLPESLDVTFDKLKKAFEQK